MNFGGLNLKDGAVNTLEAVIAQGVDLSQDVIEPSKDHNAMNSSALAGAVMGIYRRGGLLAMVGGTFYDEWVSKATGFSTSALVGFERVNDRVYFCNGVDECKVHDGAVRKMGIIAPIVAPSVAVSSNGDITGNGYQWAISFYDSSNDRESIMSPISSALNLTDQTAYLSDLEVSSDSAVDKKRIYRMGGVHAEYMFVAEIANSTTTYTDEKVDTSLTDAATNGDNEPPPLLTGFVYHEGVLFGWGHPSFPWRLYYSRSAPYLEAWPLGSYEGIGAYDDPIKHCETYHGQLIIHTKKRVFLLSGDTPGSYSVHPIPGEPGTVAASSPKAGDNLVFYLTRQGIRGVTSETGEAIKENELLPLFDKDEGFGFMVETGEFGFMVSTGEYGFWVEYGMGAEVAAYFDDRYIVSESDRLKCLVLDGRDKVNRGIRAYHSPVAVAGGEITCFYQDSDKLFFGTEDGYVKEWQGATTFEDVDYKTVPYDFKKPEEIKLLKEISVDCKAVPGAVTEPLTVEIYCDDTLKATRTIGKPARGVVEFRLPPVCKGYQIALRFVASTGYAVYVYGFKYTRWEVVNG